MRRRRSPYAQGRLRLRCRKWPRRGHVPHILRMERTRILRHHRRQLGPADRRRRHRPGHDHSERHAECISLLSSKFEIGADASAAAGPVGRHASADTDWKMNAEILTYSRARGAFAGLTLDGASIRRDDDSTRDIYGPHVSNRSILQWKRSRAGSCPLLPRRRTGCEGTGNRFELTATGQFIAGAPD